MSNRKWMVVGDGFFETAIVGPFDTEADAEKWRQARHHLYPDGSDGICAWTVTELEMPPNARSEP